MESDLFATAEHQAFRDTVRRFTEQELVPRAREFDRNGRLDKALYPKMGELGMLGLRYDPRWGGAGLDWSFTAVLFEELARCDNAGVVLGISVHTDMATPSLHEHGSDALRDEFLAPAIRGERVGAIAVTEPGAGSDVAAIKTRARRDGGDWVVSGSKTYITNAATADFLCLLAVTDPDAGHRGMTQILVPTDAPGVRHDLLDKIGNLGSDTGIFFLDDVRVPLRHAVGEPGQGFRQQMQQFQDERLVLALSTVAQSRHLWERTRTYCDERRLFGKRLAEMQVTQFKLTELAIELAAAEALVRECLRRRLAGADATTEISMAKVHSARVARRVADDCLQLEGGFGYMRESPAGRGFVDARLMSIGGGSDETMISYLARRLGI
ncbi:MAG: acyl-CoA dehydrogenase family protein [Deltaproteobacteria bacterium]|nr:acyl-CoA dehydrogenase family protein [Deltaproteobacteria bacterium]